MVNKFMSVVDSFPRESYPLPRLGVRQLPQRRQQTEKSFLGAKDKIQAHQEDVTGRILILEIP